MNVNNLNAIVYNNGHDKYLNFIMARDNDTILISFNESELEVENNVIDLFRCAKWFYKRYRDTLILVAEKLRFAFFNNFEYSFFELFTLFYFEADTKFTTLIRKDIGL